jgi:Phage tail sheath protein subtilisin-like domain/Phage tail sheath C-terminal domain
MVDFLSPIVNVSEIDLTTIVPAVGTTEGAFVGKFAWGPADTIRIVSNQNELVRFFRAPTNNNFVDFFTAANFLDYARNLKVVRVTGASNNATSGAQAVTINNETDFESLTIETAYGEFAARYPGAAGSSLKVSMCTSANGFSSNMSLTATTTANSNTLVFSAAVSTDPIRPLVIGDTLVVSNSAGVMAQATVLSIASDTVVTDTLMPANTAIANVTAKWAYSNFFNGAPDSTDYATNLAGANDEIHIVVVDEDGAFTGVRGRLLERFAYLSKAADARTPGGTNVYYKNYINRYSKYIYSLNHPTAVTSTWGLEAANTTFAKGAHVYYMPLTRGSDVDADTAAKVTAWTKHFGNKEAVDISLLLSADADTTVAQTLKTIVDDRKDCVAFISPEKDDVVNSYGTEVANIVAFRNTIGSSSRMVMDCNWKYQFDKYNNTYRWVPLNGDIAGLCVKTDYERDAWWSPAGFNRGQIKNIIKLAWNPTQAERDELYKVGVNPVVMFPGEGAILYGDKTLQSKPSAFDRINVRRLFIVLEKAIATAAKYSLFEFNDQFTRAQFVALIEPYLRDIQGRRGIYDFRVVCDETNNTPEVIDRNEFIGDIYIKPARSINFIQLNFVAVRTGVSFDEIVGRF